MTLTFEAETDYPVGFYPVGVVVADVNGDGHLDVVSADFTGGVDVLLGTGTGTFAPAIVYDAGQSPVAVAVADVNGDGRPDIVAADENGDTVSVLLGSAGGGFAPAVSYAAGSYPYSVTVADLNGDGPPDLVVGDSAGGIDVLLANEVGGFGPATSYVAGTDFYSAVVADVNLDGKPDIVADGLNGVELLLGDGAGGFSAASVVIPAQSPRSVAVADLNGDGNPDLAVASNGGVQVLLGDGTGGFTLAETYSISGQSGYGVSAGDVNGDGNSDLIVTSSFSPGRNNVVSTATVFLGDGTGAFTPDASLRESSSPVVADLNGDGLGDLVFPGVGVVLNDSPACYCPGTLILTDRGEMLVEILAIGDTVVTASGRHRAVKWIGRRSYAGRFLAANPNVQPIRFQAGSLEDGLPRRDLLVSPEHAMFIDGVLIPARCLVNGNTIAQKRGLKRVDYFHVELDTHDVLLAEGASSESYLDDDSRGMFHNASEYAALYPDASRPDGFCAPRVEQGAELEAIRRRLTVVAGEMVGAA